MGCETEARITAVERAQEYADLKSEALPVVEDYRPPEVCVSSRLHRDFKMLVLLLLLCGGAVLQVCGRSSFCVMFARWACREKKVFYCSHGNRVARRPLLTCRSSHAHSGAHPVNTATRESTPHSRPAIRRRRSCVSFTDSSVKFCFFSISTLFVFSLSVSCHGVLTKSHVLNFRDLVSLFSSRCSVPIVTCAGMAGNGCGEAVGHQNAVPPGTRTCAQGRLPRHQGMMAPTKIAPII